MHIEGFLSMRIRELSQTWSFRGSKSRNKVSVGEPAEGSLTRKLTFTPRAFYLTTLILRLKCAVMFRHGPVCWFEAFGLRTGKLVFIFLPPFTKNLSWLCFLLQRTSLVGSKDLRNLKTTVSNGYLGSRNDEERSEMRYVMRIAKLSESSSLWTQIALSG